MKKLFCTALFALSTVMGANAAETTQVADSHKVEQVSAENFIATGKSYFVDFGDQKFRLDFISPTRMIFTSPDGKNHADMDITTTKVADGVYMIYWSRKAGQHVVHVDDFKNGVSYTNIFLPDGSAKRSKGTLVEIKK